MYLTCSVFIIYCGAGRRNFASKLFVIVNHLLSASDVKPKSEKDRLKEILPALCRPNDPEPKVRLATHNNSNLSPNCCFGEASKSNILPFEVVTGRDAPIHVFPYPIRSNIFNLSISQCFLNA